MSLSRWPERGAYGSLGPDLFQLLCRGGDCRFPYATASFLSTCFCLVVLLDTWTSLLRGSRVPLLGSLN